MELSSFISTLLAAGKVTVQSQFVPFGNNDIAATEQILEQYYKEDILEMPLTAPEHTIEASVWAAKYFYYAVQLTVLRDAGEEVVKDHLKPFEGKVTASSIYSADLILRFLPELFALAKGFAPDDVLVGELHQIATDWPFSSAGIDLNSPVDDSLIFDHPSLKYVYLDRIILKKDKKRITTPEIENYIYEVAGTHLSTIWPNFESVIK